MAQANDNVDIMILTNYLLQCLIILVVEQKYGHILELVASYFVHQGRIVQQVHKNTVAATGISLCPLFMLYAIYGLK